MKKCYLIIIALFIVIPVFFSCQDDFDDIAAPSELKAHDFIWKGLNLYYYWQKDIPELSDNAFKNQAELNSFLATYTAPENLFKNLLNNYPNTDRFSVLFSDYSLLEGILSGKTLNNGIDYQLIRKQPDSDDLVGWVRYILPNSDASGKNIERGSIFYAVNGISLTVQNYNSLLSNQTYTLNLADYNNGNFSPNGESVSLTKTELAENPILINTTFDYQNHKIGYLLYNGFYNEYDNQLNSVFANFKANGATDLVLDLRYNSGGSVQTATYLASMITGQFSNQVFGKQQWNEKVGSYFSNNNPETLLNRFTNNINGNALNSLNLSKIYILTSKSSASASELIINALDPYIEVIQIGTTTTGKNVGSITLYDSPNFKKNGRSNKHKYAMQPICFKIVNSSGFGEYQNGIDPTIVFPENLSNLGTLGSVTEPLLAKAISEITGIQRSANQIPEKIYHFKDRKSMEQFGSEMYLDEIPFESLNIKFYENQ